jgi:hypothetical protein
MIIQIGQIKRTKENKAFYNRRGYEMTGETITEQIVTDNGFISEVTYIVFKGSWTRVHSVRDCGDHYIIARYSRYDSIDKKTWNITQDVEDK